VGERARLEGGLRLRGSSKSNRAEEPLITVITVVFNGAGYIEDTIKNIVSASYGNVEYIIVDGGSTDGTLDIIREYEDFVDYWLSEPDKGIYDAMNKGWALANPGSRILYLGAGDKVLKLPAAQELIDAKDAVLYGDVRLNNRLFESCINWRFKLGNTLHHQALLVPKKLHTESPFNTKYKVYADYDFNQRLYKLGAPFKRSQNLVGFALPDGISSQIGIKEMASVTKSNNGILWALLSALYCGYQAIKIKRMQRV
jgi:glycosyltransferase involved in cell wall biosynthesis